MKRYPPFQGQETESWLAYEENPGRDPGDLLLAFEASARSYWCTTDRLGSDSSATIAGGELRSSYGVSASCDDGTLAIVTRAGGQVTVGCLKPTTRARCDLLLSKISEAR